MIYRERHLDQSVRVLNRINGRDYMNISDIPGVEPKPDFITYKSKHKDYKLNISDIVDKPVERLRQQKYENIHNNPLDPQYVRYTDSRRHVQVYGDIEGSKPKQFIAPRTKRQTNLIEDISGTHSK